MKRGGSAKECFEIDDAQDFIVEMHAVALRTPR
jgi:hypothetical protein